MNQPNYIFAKLKKLWEPSRESFVLPKVGSILIIWLGNDEKVNENFLHAVARRIQDNDPSNPTIEVEEIPQNSEEELTKTKKSRARSKDEVCYVNLPVVSDNGRDCWDSEECFTQKEFFEYFEPLPEEEGEVFYDQYTRNLSKEFKTENAKLEQQISGDDFSKLMVGKSDSSKEIGNQTQLLTNDNNPETEPAEPAVSTGLVAPETRKSAGAIRNSIHQHRREIQNKQQSLASMQFELKSRLNQKMELMKTMATQVGGYLTKLEKAITTVNLYLGRDEEITVLRNGERAPANTPITIRQLVLHMDEEMALVCPEGIDFQEIKSFDDWLLIGDNLDQIIPEKRGVVVLKPRRHGRMYDENPMINAIVNKANFKSYWLLRNGDNLYRIYTGLEMDSCLIPRRTDISELFFNHRKEPLRPGTDDYYRAMEKADEKVLKTMQTTLMLQGILDRTLIFAPYPDGVAPNLLDPRTFGETVRILRDAEDVLTNGITFKEWLKIKNAHLKEGDRIVGKFDSTPYFNGQRDENRVSPKGADGYDEEFIRVVVKDNKGLKFQFERTDKVYRRGYLGGYSSGPSKVKASYRIYPSDPFILNIDAISLDEIQQFLHDRRSRQDYYHMIPTLMKAVNLKKLEQEKEQPFIDLLTRELQKIEVKSLPITKELVTEMILAWKTRNKARETLLEKESLAYKDILRSYKTLSKSRKAVDPTSLESFIENEKQNPLHLIAALQLDGIIRFFRSSRKESTYLDIFECKPDDSGKFGEPVLVKSWASKKEAKRLSGRILSETDTYHKLGELPSPYEIPETVSEQEINNGVQRDIETINKRRADKNTLPIELIAIANCDGIFKVFAIDMEDMRRDKRYPKDTQFARRRVSKNKSGEYGILEDHWTNKDVETYSSFWSHGPKFFSTGKTPKGKEAESKFKILPFTPPMNADLGGIDWAWYEKNPNVIYFNQEAFSKFTDLLRKEIQAERKEKKIFRAANHMEDRVLETAKDFWKEKETRIYLEQGGDLEFWDDHCKTLIKPEFNKIHESLTRLLRGIARKQGVSHLSNLTTLREILREGDTLEEKHRGDETGFFHRDFQNDCHTVRNVPWVAEVLDIPLKILENKKDE
jgi:hypothetical protein